MTQPNPRVFIVDDHAASTAGLQALMAAYGIALEAFPTAEAFLEAYDGFTEGCLILDIRLGGGMSGFDLQELLVAKEAPLSIVMISGHADDAEQSRALSNGARAFLTKPFSGAELCTLVRDELAQITEGRVAPLPRQE